MSSSQRAFRLLLALSLGLAFFGCVGLPRRRPPVETPMRPALAQRPRAELPQGTQPPPPAPKAADPVPSPPIDPPPPPVIRTTPPPPELPPPELPPPPSAAPQKQPEPPPPSPPAASDTDPPANPMAPLRQLHEAAVRQYAGIDSYIVRLTRREIVKGKERPEEVLLFKFRKEPWSVYFKWLGKEGRGREVVYVKGKHGDKIHTLLAAGDMPFVPAGRRIALSPDSPLIRNNSRHSIHEAGVGRLIERIGEILAALEKGDTSQGTANYLGKRERPEFAHPLHAVEWRVPAGADESLPRGGRRWCYLDPENHLPVLIITHDEKGREVEYYRYDRFQFPVHLDDADFDPEKVWGKEKR